MQKPSSRANMVLIGGIAGIIGVLLTVVSDLILLGKPVSAYTFLKLGTESMAGLAQWRITTGTFLGVVVLPLQIAGLITVYYGLKPAGRFISLAVVIVTAHALIMGVAFHVSYAFIGSGWKLYYEIGSGNIIASEMIKKFDYYWKIIVFIILTELLFSSICYTFVILRRKTLYPKWMSLLNPLCVFLFMYPLIFALPAPVGGFIAPAYLNLSTMVFMTFSTATIYKSCKINAI